MWREYVNDLLEEVIKWGGNLIGEEGVSWPSIFSVDQESTVSRIDCTAEDLFNRRVRKPGDVSEQGTWRIEEARRERTGVGPDQLRMKSNRDPDDGKSTIYADDSSILTSGSTWNQLEHRMHSSLRPTFNNMNASRLKVTEDKTQYIIIESNQKRQASGGSEVVTSIGEKKETSGSCEKLRGAYLQ